MQKVAGGGEEESGEGMAAGMEMGVQPRMIQSIMLGATGEFFLLLGMLFVLLGIAAFVTDFLEIKGSGEFIVGLLLVIGAAMLLMRSREQMKRQMARPPLGPPVMREAKGKAKEPSIYR